MAEENHIAIFNGKEVRKVIHNDEWWFVVTDIITVLTDSTDPSQYIKRLRSRDAEIDSLYNKGGVQIVPPLGLEFDTAGGKQKLVCWNTQGIFRLIQSVPSPKAEPFKLWLARVGYERVQEIEDPELATARTVALYKAKGYSNVWIDKRMRGIAVRDTLTQEWQQRGIKQAKDYAILTAEISKATFGLTPGQYKKTKSLKRENLRDHMTDLELIFSMLGEAATTEITTSKDAQGFVQNKSAAKEGGKVAGDARLDLETKTGKKVVSKQNYLETSELEQKKQITDN